MSTCPTCGSPVEVVSSDEGTSHYEVASVETINAIFDQVMEERRDQLITEAAADRILARVVEARFGVTQ